MTTTQISALHARMKSYCTSQRVLGFTRDESIARTARKFDIRFTETEQILGVFA
jgi:hypothetical protein